VSARFCAIDLAKGWATRRFRTGLGLRLSGFDGAGDAAARGSRRAELAAGGGDYRRGAGSAALQGRGHEDGRDLLEIIEERQEARVRVMTSALGDRA
jgi:hypothetical protein